MKYYDYIRPLILERLASRHTISNVVFQVADAASQGGVAFYPCSRYTRAILHELRVKHPNLISSIVGCFDRSLEASMEGFPVYQLKELDQFKQKISLLVIASNTYYDRQLADVHAHTGFQGDVFCTSRFDVSLDDLPPEAIMSSIDGVYQSLADSASRITYLHFWLSRLMNDEELTSIFISENDLVTQEGDKTYYRGYTLEGLSDADIRKELNAEIYWSPLVYPEPGDTILDIGGFKGDTAIFFADKVGVQGSVYVFEPIKANFNVLCQNITSNRLDEIITAVNKGCSDSSASQKATSAKSGAAWSFVNESDGTEEICLTTVDEFVQQAGLTRVDFIKMDVEGMEERVLLGAKETISRFMPKMVIPLYHETSDLYKLPLLVKQLGNYDLYVNCKVDGPFGINLFCKPCFGN